MSNSNWLTITAGGSGTGSGSFTLTATPNPNDTDLVGTITVMNQTMTVILGDPTGAPGAGRVTINGAPQHRIIQPCKLPEDPCPELIYNSGSVSVTVGSQTFYVGYGDPSDTATALASALAGQMNYSDSPLSATASGSTINIRSSINGAATNYSLSTSDTYDAGYFSSSAFTATTSGQALTGGSN